MAKAGNRAQPKARAKQNARPASAPKRNKAKSVEKPAKSASRSRKPAKTVRWKNRVKLCVNSKPKSGAPQSRPIYKTNLGSMFCGDSSKLLTSKALSQYEGKVQLVFTSPPFPLNSKKSYGNFQGEEYIEWLASFAPKLRNLLTPDGSIVIEIGNAWESERPVMSTVVMRALLKFMEKENLNLCQEFVWYNPARLPSPARWVNIERSRVKDAFTKIWWMSPVDRPKADNRRILKDYSEGMKRLIKTGKYNAGTRPSRHQIGKTSFNADNGGAIPPNAIDGDLAANLTNMLRDDAVSILAKILDNVLKEANTRSQDKYQVFCRENDITPHPARMPAHLVEFFVRFLTDKNDLVLDPFAGSNTTGMVAERNRRRWLSIEAKWPFAAPSVSHFSDCPSVKINSALKAG